MFLILIMHLQIIGTVKEKYVSYKGDRLMNNEVPGNVRYGLYGSIRVLVQLS